MKSLSRAINGSWQQLVWALSGAMLLSAGALWFLFMKGAEPVSDAFTAPWWLFVLGFFAVESWVVTMHFRSESTSFSFFDIPMLLGVLFADPTMLVPAVIIGSFLALHVKRKNPPMKTVFNCANFALHVALVWVIVDLFTDQPLEPVGWLVLVVAAIVTSTIELSALWLVLWMVEGSMPKERIISLGAVGTVVTCANSVQAIIMALLLTIEPLSLLLLATSTLVLFVAYRSYLAEKDQRERVEFLYSSTRDLKTADKEATPAASLVEEASTMFRAGVVEVHLPGIGAGPGADSGSITRFSQDGISSRPMASADQQVLARLTDLASPPVILSEDDLEGEDIRDRDFKDAMMGALNAGEGRVGLLVVANRLGNVSTFTPEDLQLFTTLVHHAALALENDQLEMAITQLRSLERELAHQASHDGLTGLANRALLGRRLDELLQDDDPQLALMYLDLDDFKVVNDTLGHAAGDSVLVEASKRLRACIRPTDVVARLGGDEFAILLVGNPDPGAVAHRVLEELNDPYELDGAQPASVGASAGLSIWEDGVDAGTLVSRADAAMYTAKEQGKGAVAFFEEEMHENLSARQTLRSQLRSAVADQNFHVLYQPIVELATSRVVAAEALVRWVSPDGLLLPRGFIDEAEKSGLIVPIDTFVFAQALRDLKDLDDEGFNDLWLTSNLSMRTLQEKDLVNRIKSEIDGAGLPSERLVLEVTETALMHDPELTNSQLNLLRDEGMRVALDDFGTGYSSLSYLRRFPVDILKIAQPFVADLETSDDTFVRAMASLGHTLGLDVLAEGIEHEQSLRTLNSLNVEYGQGYYFARPLGIEQLTDVLRSQEQTNAAKASWF